MERTSRVVIYLVVCKNCLAHFFFSRIFPDNVATYIYVYMYIVNIHCKG